MATRTQRQTEKPTDKYKAIIEATRQLFTTQGYEATTIAQVAKLAGVAVGTVYLYFANKVELLCGLLKEYEVEFVSAMQQPELAVVPYHLRAHPLMEACFALCNQNREMVQLMGLQPQVMGISEKTQAGLIQLSIKQLLDEGIAAGVYRPIDSHAAAVIGFGMVSQALEQCFDVEDGRNQELYIRTLADAFNHWLVKPEYWPQIYGEVKP